MSGRSHSVLLYRSSVYASGCAFAAISAMMTPPTRVSTTTGWPSLAASSCATRRDARSLPPAAPAVSKRIGRTG
jgi:hypothetical protein